MNNPDTKNTAANDNGCAKTAKHAFAEAMKMAHAIATPQEQAALDGEKTELSALSRAFTILAKRLDEMDHNLVDNGTKYTPVVPSRRARIESRQKR